MPCSRALATAAAAGKVGANGTEYILPAGAREEFNEKGKYHSSWPQLL
jgi:hypothetical protein